MGDLAVLQIFQSPLTPVLRRIGGDRLRLYLLGLSRFLVGSDLSLRHSGSPATFYPLSYSIKAVIQVWPMQDLNIRFGLESGHSANVCNGWKADIRMLSFAHEFAHQARCRSCRSLGGT